MVTLEEVLNCQNDLDKLCADRPLISKEIFQGNSFYGIDSVIKEYAGLPKCYSLKVVIPHGVTLDLSDIWEAEKLIKLPIVFCYPPNRRNIYKQKSKKKVILSASPFLYLVNLHKNQPKPARRGTLFFPHHSTHYVTVQMDYRILAERLKNLPEIYQPVTICIYWKDYLLNHHLPFIEKGLSVVSAGHMYDKNFLHRIYHLCSIHRFASGNGIGSNIFYAFKSGCIYFYFDQLNYTSVADEDILKRDVPKIPEGIISNIKTKFPFGCLQQTKAQNSFVNFHLGSKYFKKKKVLLAELFYAELLDKFQFSYRNQKQRYVDFPNFFWRLIRELRM